MSVKISLLKKSKKIVSTWLDINYDGAYAIFYSIGTQQKDFNDQFLKIELDCEPKKFPYYASVIRRELLNNDPLFSDLRFKILGFNK